MQHFEQTLGDVIARIARDQALANQLCEFVGKAPLFPSPTQPLVLPPADRAALPEPSTPPPPISRDVFPALAPKSADNENEHGLLQEARTATKPAKKPGTRGSFMERAQAVLPKLPAQFTGRDVVAIDATMNRDQANYAIEGWIASGVVAVVTPGGRGKLGVYRLTKTSAAPLKKPEPTPPPATVKKTTPAPTATPADKFAELRAPLAGKQARRKEGECPRAMRRAILSLGPEWTLEDVVAELERKHPTRVQEWRDAGSVGSHITLWRDAEEIRMVRRDAKTMKAVYTRTATFQPPEE